VEFVLLCAYRVCGDGELADFCSNDPEVCEAGLGADSGCPDGEGCLSDCSGCVPCECGGAFGECDDGEYCDDNCLCLPEPECSGDILDFFIADGAWCDPDAAAAWCAEGETCGADCRCEAPQDPPDPVVGACGDGVVDAHDGEQCDPAAAEGEWACTGRQECVDCRCDSPAIDSICGNGCTLCTDDDGDDINAWVCDEPIDADACFDRAESACCLDIACPIGECLICQEWVADNEAHTYEHTGSTTRVCWDWSDEEFPCSADFYSPQGSEHPPCGLNCEMCRAPGIGASGNGPIHLCETVNPNSTIGRQCFDEEEYYCCGGNVACPSDRGCRCCEDADGSPSWTCWSGEPDAACPGDRPRCN